MHNSKRLLRSLLVNVSTACLLGGQRSRIELNPRLGKEAVFTELDAEGRPVRSEKVAMSESRGARTALAVASSRGTETLAPSAGQLANARGFADQLGPRLKQLGMSEQQVETLSAAAAKEQARSAHQGSVRSWHLSKDGSQIAMRQEHPPLREFDVAEALGKSAHTHWNEAAELQLGAQGAVREAVLASSLVMAAVPSITAESAIRLA